MTHPKRACLITFGCQMNDYDSGRLGELLVSKGWVLTDRREEADLILFNTCSIREKAVQKLMNHLEQVRSLKKKRKGIIIAVGGCVAEQEGQALLDKAPWLNLVVGPQHLPSIPYILEKFIPGGQQVLTGSGEHPAWSRENLTELKLFPKTDFSPVATELKLFPKTTAAPAATGLKLLPKARSLLGTVTIMQGCNNYCTYCVVPYVRGPELSREPGDILEEIRGLVSRGVKDLTLLGQNVNSYGAGAANPTSFPELLEQVDATGINRLRFMTSHPKDFPKNVVNLFGQLPSLCEKVHLPLQSGSDRILTAMGRIYTKDSYLQLVDDLRTACPGLALTTDIIVGFPGETEEDFLQTINLVETVKFDSMFSFNYSDRPQTRSAKLEPKLPLEEQAYRLTHLQKVQKGITLAKNAAHVGQTLEVLVERSSNRYPGQLIGRARNFKLVHFDGALELIGQLVPVRITEGWGASLRGQLNLTGSNSSGVDW